MIGSRVGEVAGASGRDVTLKETAAFKTAAVVVFVQLRSILATRHG